MLDVRILLSLHFYISRDMRVMPSEISDRQEYSARGLLDKMINTPQGCLHLPASLRILGNGACWILLSPELCRTSVDMSKITQYLAARMEAEQLTAIPNHCLSLLCKLAMAWLTNSNQCGIQTGCHTPGTIIACLVKNPVSWAFLD